MLLTNPIDTFYEQGNDALANMFEISFTIGAVTKVPTGITDSIKYRITNFSLPEVIVNTYDKWYKGERVVTPSGLNGDPKTNSFTLRVAKNYTFYLALREWAENSKRNPDSKDGFRVDASVNPIDENDTNTIADGVWALKGWYPTNVAGLTFDQTSGEPLTVQVTGTFLKCLEPGATV